MNDDEQQQAQEQDERSRRGAQLMAAFRELDARRGWWEAHKLAAHRARYAHRMQEAAARQAEYDTSHQGQDQVVRRVEYVVRKLPWPKRRRLVSEGQPNSGGSSGHTYVSKQAAKTRATHAARWQPRESSDG